MIRKRRPWNALENRPRFAHQPLMLEAQPGTASGRAVFLSYAREDSPAVQRLADTLRAGGVEVWFDQSELRGGDLWDQKIRRQIRECALFVPLISATTQARSEGYFRREWKMAADRLQDMSESRTFIVPVIIDDTPEAAADVPEQFLRAHCARLPAGATPPGFVAQVRRLLDSPHAPPPRGGEGPVVPVRRGRGLGPALAVVALIAVGLAVWHPWQRALPPDVAPPAAGADRPDRPVNANSIAVLPFTDLSPDKDQEYMSDGLAEEMLNLLTKIPGLHVTSRSSAFSFKGKNAMAGEIARQLNVAHLLEGSVRKSGDRLRVTAQLIEARTDKHLWSETYDRDVKDIFAVQDEIAAAVVTQLKLALLGPAPQSRKTDPRAYALFLQARQLGRLRTDEGFLQALKALDEALAIDPNYAAAWDQKVFVHFSMGDREQIPQAEGRRLAREANARALASDPNFSPSHARLAWFALWWDRDPAAAARHITRAVELDPTHLGVWGTAATVASAVGRLDLGVALGEHLTRVDPLNPINWVNLGIDYLESDRPERAIAALNSALAITPGRSSAQIPLAKALVLSGQAAKAMEVVDDIKSEATRRRLRPVVLQALGRKAESDAALGELLAADKVESEAYNLAVVYAYRGEADEAFRQLERAGQDSFGASITVAADVLFSSLHKDPRWVGVLRQVGMAPEQLAGVKLDLKVPKR